MVNRMERERLVQMYDKPKTVFALFAKCAASILIVLLLVAFGAGRDGEGRADATGGARSISAAWAGSATSAEAQRKQVFHERRQRIPGSDPERAAAQAASTIQAGVTAP